MAEVRKLLVAVLVVVVSLSWPAVSAQTHHVVGGDGGWTSSSGRVFRVGDKISFTYPATEESIVELQSRDDLISCNLANPIRMYTDSDRHITLEKEGIRYFTSANPENCKNGLKLPVYVQPTPFDHPFELPPPFWPPFEPEPEHGPPDEPPPEHGPPPFEPWPKPFPDLPPPHVPDTPPPHVPHSPPPPVPHSPPPYVPHSPPPPPPEHGPPPFEPWPKPFPDLPPPHVPDTPPPHVPHSPPPPVPHSPPPYVPHSPPPPPHVPHSPPPPPLVPHSPPPPVAPSASTHLNVFSFVLFAALALSFMGQL